MKEDGDNDDSMICKLEQLCFGVWERAYRVQGVRNLASFHSLKRYRAWVTSRSAVRMP